MKKFFVILFCLVTLCVQAEPFKVLFLGNSYTSVNDLPSLVTQVAGSVGEVIETSNSTPGGCTLNQHTTNSASQSLIQQGGWDIVVIQAQSQEPSFPYAQFMSETYPYATQLCEQIHQYSPDARIIFYMTWGRENGDAYNAQFFPVLGTYEGMDSLLRARYIMMAEDNQVDVSPVGAVWHYIRHNYPEIMLYGGDESHPSMAGSYVAACTFFTLMLERNPMDISTDCGLDSETARIIRECTKCVAYDSLSYWIFSESIDTTGVESYQQQPIQIYPNPAVSQISVDLSAYEVQQVTMTIYDAMGRSCQSISIKGEQKPVVNVSDLEVGNYYIRFEFEENKSQTIPFVKIR